MQDLKYFEQNVNSHYSIAKIKELDDSLVPGSAVSHRLKWKRIPLAGTSCFDDGSSLAKDLLNELCQDGYIYLPIHPLELSRWPDEDFLESGSISISASYRTVFFDPDPGGLLSCLAKSGASVMMKLHLEHALPGIDGDRRMRKQIVEKCVALSTPLQKILKEESFSDHCEVLPEFLGYSNDETGVIFRRMPDCEVLPLFSLYSPDSRFSDSASHIERWVRSRYGDNVTEASQELGEQLAKPLLLPLFAGFRSGFSMEMHAQNVLFKPGESTLFKSVFFRDLEGVVFSNRYRLAQGLEPLFKEYDNSELISDYRSMSRWFNRNVDHDLGRVFTASLDALVACGYFGLRERASGVRSIRNAARECVTKAGVGRLNFLGRIFPISRSPYGNGLGKGFWYRSGYR